MLKYSPLITILSPLIGWLILTLFRSSISRRVAGVISSAAVAISCITVGLSANTILGGHPIDINLFNWISIPAMTLSLGLTLDKLSLLMGVMITGVGLLVHIYSIGYMAHDDNGTRYFSYLNLFIFFMLLLVMSDSMIGTFMGWEGVGLCSYLLIGFWNHNQLYLKAAVKAFVMNRIGDVGFVIAMAILAFQYGTLSYSELIHHLTVAPMSALALLTVGIGIVVALCGKSAQFPLYTWLPDAMAGPTPVSALIHAATMVTSGIYLVNRLHIIFDLSHPAQQLLLILGLLTLMIGGITATFQNDLKKILAYSTVSQLGFMVTALGLGWYQVALFHMLTHAFFKALLFLSAGNIIHGLDGEQDIKNMGGVRKLLPVTTLMMGIGTLSLIGLPPLSGFFSKDAILAAALAKSPIIFGILVLGAALTSFYMSRLIGYVFLGTYRGSVSHPHEGSVSMTGSLIVLGALSIAGGIFKTVFDLPETHHIEILLICLSLGIISTFGTVGIWWARRTVALQPSVRVIVGIDAVYDRFVVAPYLYFSRVIMNAVDRGLNHTVMNVGTVTRWVASGVVQIHTGNIGTYVILMILGIIALFLKVVAH